jgi:hypothetical protein
LIKCEFGYQTPIGPVVIPTKDTTGESTSFNGINLINEIVFPIFKSTSSSMVVFQTCWDELGTVKTSYDTITLDNDAVSFN